jgi:hypothetical protein
MKFLIQQIVTGIGFSSNTVFAALCSRWEGFSDLSEAWKTIRHRAKYSELKLNVIKNAVLSFLLKETKVRNGMNDETCILTFLKQPVRI